LKCPKCGHQAEATAFDVIRRKPKMNEPTGPLPLFKSLIA
jgi:hypothetical protein